MLLFDEKLFHAGLTASRGTLGELLDQWVARYRLQVLFFSLKVFGLCSLRARQQAFILFFTPSPRGWPQVFRALGRGPRTCGSTDASCLVPKRGVFRGALWLTHRHRVFSVGFLEVFWHGVVVFIWPGSTPHHESHCSTISTGLRTEADLFA